MLKHLGLVSVLLLAAMCVAFPRDPSTDIDHTQQGHLVCGEVNGTKMLLADPVTVKKIAACSDPNIYGEGEGKKNPGCAVYCIYQAILHLDDNELPTADIYNKWIDKKWINPEAAKYSDTAKEHFLNCVNKFASKIDKTDPTCKVAGEFGACNFWIQTTFFC